MNKLETEYSDLVSELNEKLQNASQSINEAYQALSKARKTCLDIDDVDLLQLSKSINHNFDQLIDLMVEKLEEDGWQASSLYC